MKEEREIRNNKITVYLTLKIGEEYARKTS